MHSKLLIPAILLLLSQIASAGQEHRCAKAAVKQANKLLKFHAGPDDRIEIDHSVHVLNPSRNPASDEQNFDVLEVWGYIYKGQYRMRFIYARSLDNCLLMGQEILEHARL